jgi:hypothetical protein
VRIFDQRRNISILFSLKIFAGFVFAFTLKKVVTFKRKATCDEDFLLLTFRGNSRLA